MTGNETLTTGQILRCLDECGVRPGTYWPALSNDLVRNDMILCLPELRWLTVNVHGSRAEVIVREKDPLPDITPDTVESFPCVFCLHRRDTVQLAKANHRSFDTHTRQLAKSLERRIGTAMPIVIGASENVINGIGRLQVAAEAKRPVVRCVVVTKEQEAFATAMLNDSVIAPTPP